ncbi:MAG: tetratricopeptide repeat protein [Myxococcales bacterium]|nr:tetratricopeptide repeat protein [Myxococcales bacterium]
MRRLAGAMFVLMLGAPALAAPERSAEERLEHASGLLADERRYAEAIAEFRALLDADPELRVARSQLAAVLSWQGKYEESLRHYELLLADRPNDADVAIARAEVLSWAGRYDEARTAFEELLSVEGDHPRVLRGLARTENWSGHRIRADALYQQSLALVDDAETRAEWKALRSSYGSALSTGGSRFSDNGDFARTDLYLEGATYLNLANRITARIGTIDVSQPGTTPGLQDAPSDDRATELRAEHEHEWAPEIFTRIALSGRSWRHADSDVGGLLSAEYRSEDLLVGFDLERASHLEYSDSFEALQQDIEATGMALRTWKRLSSRWSFWGRLRLLDLTDGNRRHDIDASFTAQPFSESDFRVGLSGNLTGYADASDAYYDPERDMTGLVFAEHQLNFRRHWRIQYGGRVGYGRAKTPFDARSGISGGAHAGIRWDGDWWSLHLDAHWSYSQRGEPYSGERLALRLERRF